MLGILQIMREMLRDQPVNASIRRTSTESDYQTREYSYLESNIVGCGSRELVKSKFKLPLYWF